MAKLTNVRIGKYVFMYILLKTSDFVTLFLSYFYNQNKPQAQFQQK